jgi:hypothetical protein
MGLISNFFSAVAAGFNWATGRSAVKNAAPMQANAAAQTKQKISDDATKAVAEDDLAAVRKLGAE